MKKRILFFTIASLLILINPFSTLSQSVGISGVGAVPDPSALLDIDATGANPMGWLIPRLTTTERNNIATSCSCTPTEGLEIFNTTTKCFEAYVNGGWYAVSCPAACSPPAAPTANAASAITGTSFTANWSASTGATSYYFDVSINSGFSSFVTGYNNVNIGNVTSYSVTGLAYSTTYYYRLRAAAACIGANSNTITTTTSAFVCGSALSISHTIGSIAPETKTVSYGTVTTSLSGASKCWITRNLGGTNQAGSATDATDASAGWYWQFNLKQGYFFNGASRTPNSAWIGSISETSNWLAANDPCTIELGTGWRIPTKTEWTNADATWSSYTDTYSSVLKLHAGGDMNFSDGTKIDRGTIGYYWSSTDNASATAWDLNFNNTVSYPFTGGKAYGFALRCIMD